MPDHRIVMYLIFLLIAACQEVPREDVSFNRDIRPIFNEKCLRCHGGVKANGHFSLLFEEDAFSPAESGKIAIVPGNHRKSELYRRIVHPDPELRMPYQKNPLTEEEITLIARWIDEGAVWEKHWAYEPPRTDISPPPIDTSWILHDIDRFIYKALIKRGLFPAEPAEKEVLLRRLFLDLTGLPPEKSEIEQYLSDPENGFYQSWVDRLLSSPHFGERWASMWLDLARYADTKGYEKDQNREIWRYRDYVINALNADKPFDEFTVDQLAGDLLPDPTEDQLIATAFHRNSISNDEGGTDDEEFRVAGVIDRVNTTWEVWQATTMACVQCHTHPYDPFRQEDFYRSMAVFNNATDRDNYNENPKLYSYLPDKASQFETILDWLYNHPRLTDLPPRTGSLHDQKNALMAHLRYRITEAEDYTASSPFIEIIWPDLDMLWQTQDSSWIKFDGIDLTGVEKIGFTAATELIFAGSISIHLDSLNGPKIGNVRITKTGEWKGWQGNKPPRSELLREFIATLSQTEGTHDLYFRFWVGDTYIQHLFYLDRINYYEKDAPYRKHGKDVEKKLAELISIPATSTPVIRELPPAKSRKTHIFDRGSWLVPGEEVLPAIPPVFANMTNQPVNNRLDFARWLVGDTNPLTARVIVNRIWEQLFGVGLVETMEEFGSQGSSPTHPELLDWLALRLVREHQWHLKPLIRDIVLSATYRQSSIVDSLKLELDPDNRWLSRGVRIRLSSEQIRDQILSVSGLLNRSLGGPSVIIPEMRFPDAFIPSWALTDKEQHYRRSLYLFWKRTDPYQNMITFDSPDRTVCTSRRIRTNTPLQALNLLNDPVYMQASIALARQMLAAGNDAAGQIRYGYRLVTCRQISREKLSLLERLYIESLENYRPDQSDPEFLSGKVDRREEQNPLAALTVVANALLNLDEFIVKS